MKNKFFVYALIVISMILIGCGPQEELPEIIQEPREIKEVDLILGFMPNTKPEIDTTLLSPLPGLRGHEVGDVINLTARNTTKYKLYKWEIKTSNDTKEVFEQNYSLTITENHTIIAFFGCNIDDVCEEDYECKEGLCVDITKRQTPPFRLAYSDLGDAEDKEKLEQIKQELRDEKYSITSRIQLFDEINATAITNQVFLAIMEKKAIIITDDTPPEHYTKFKEKLKQILRAQEFETKTMTNTQIRSADLHDLFFK